MYLLFPMAEKDTRRLGTDTEMEANRWGQHYKAKICYQLSIQPFAIWKLISAEISMLWIIVSHWKHL